MIRMLLLASAIAGCTCQRLPSGRAGKLDSRPDENTTGAALEASAEHLDAACAELHKNPLLQLKLARITGLVCNSRGHATSLLHEVIAVAARPDQAVTTATGRNFPGGDGSGGVSELSGVFVAASPEEPGTVLASIQRSLVGGASPESLIPNLVSYNLLGSRAKTGSGNPAARETIVELVTRLGSGGNFARQIVPAMPGAHLRQKLQISVLPFTASAGGYFFAFSIEAGPGLKDFRHLGIVSSAGSGSVVAIAQSLAVENYQQATIAEGGLKDYFAEQERMLKVFARLAGR